MPGGFKWFVDGLIDGSLGFAGEESAGASFLRRDGSVWTTDKDGIILGLLAAEITARTGRDPGEALRSPHARVGRALLRADRRAGDARAEGAAEGAVARSDRHDGTCRRADPRGAHAAPGNGAPFGGIKVIAENGWFAARPSGTEDVYKIYAESFRSEDHLRQIQQEAQDAIARVFEKAKV